MTRRAPSGRRYLLYGGVLALLAVAAATGLILGSWQQQRGRVPVDAPATGNETPPGLGTDEVMLYFVGEDGTSLVERPVELALSAAPDTLTRAHLIVDRQLGEAPSPLASPFPAGTRVRAIYLTPAGDAFVDLSADVSRGHPGGSLDELFTVYALVNALTTNVPEISAVQILVDGREVDTLAGHVDLRHPLEGNMRWVARSADASTADDRRTDSD